MDNQNDRHLMQNNNDTGSDVADSRRSFLRGATLLGAACAAGYAAAPRSAHAALEVEPGPTFDVRQFGALGDGEADDTTAVQAAINAAIEYRSGHIHVPAGRYRITQSLTFSSASRIDITGAGRSSVLLHVNNEPLLMWDEDASCVESSIQDLAFDSIENDKSPDVAVISCRGGAERSFFSNLFFTGNGARMGSGIVVERVADTTSFDHCLMWGVTGTGYQIARGSEVRIFGGRVVSNTNPYESLGEKAIGVHVMGNNGGVHVVTTDLIGVHTCMQIGEPGHTSNREIFITHATFDSSIHGLVQVDNAYTSIAGCWAASCDEEQILISENSPGAIMSIAGGTIFNGGTYGRDGAHNGIDVRAGSFMLSGVTVRHNKGTGILVGENVRDYAITGCRIVSNGTGAKLAGDRFTFTGNVVAHNDTDLVYKGGENKVVENNIVG